MPALPVARLSPHARRRRPDEDQTYRAAGVLARAYGGLRNFRGGDLVQIHGCEAHRFVLDASFRELAAEVIRKHSRRELVRLAVRAREGDAIRGLHRVGKGRNPGATSRYRQEQAGDGFRHRRRRPLPAVLNAVSPAFTCGLPFAEHVCDIIEQVSRIYSLSDGEMSSKEQVVQSILEVAREMNESLARRIDIERGEDAPLFGKEGVLDSLALVSFIVAVEQALDESLGVTVTLADERAVSQRASPFRTVGALADYVVAQTTGQHD